MKTNSLDVTLKDSSTGREHTFQLSQERIFHCTGEDQFLALKVNGVVVAKIDVTTMTKDVRDEEGDYHTKLSDNFYINFHAEDPVCKADCSAMVWVEPVAQQ